MPNRESGKAAEWLSGSRCGAGNEQETPWQREVLPTTFIEQNTNYEDIHTWTLGGGGSRDRLHGNATTHGCRRGK